MTSYKEPWKTSVWDSLRLYSAQLATAGGSAALAKTAVYPLERIKILLQVQAMNGASSPDHVTGLRDALRRIPEREGYLALWRGNSAAVSRLVPEVGLMFMLNEQLQTMFSPVDGSPPGIWSHVAAGSATGVIKTLAVYPLDLAQTRLAADISAKDQSRLYYGPLHCLTQTSRIEGLRGLYKGVVASAAGIVPYVTVSFTVYRALSDKLASSLEARNTWLYPAAKVGIGASAAMLGQGVAYPIDTVQRRMQLSGAPAHAIVYKSYWHCVRSMTSREGLSSFYRGFGINCLKVAPGAAIHFLAYDLIKVAIVAYNTNHGPF